jgi:UV excision repair protein RAD23
MKLLIKNLHNESFTVDCDGEDTIKVLKEKIAAKDDLREKYDPELLKLLYTGKVMDDEETVEHYAIKPDGFLVLVKQTPGKPKPPPKKKPNPNQGFNNPMHGFGKDPFGQHGFGKDPFGQHGFGQIPFGQHGFGQNTFGQSGFGQNAFGQSAFGQSGFGQSGFGQNTSKQTGFEQESHFPAIGTAANTVSGGLSDTSPEAFSTAENREEALKNLLAMGFDREQSEKALRASFYNVETAIEYITSGNIPPVNEPPAISQGVELAKPGGNLLGQGNPPTPSPVRPQPGAGMGASLQQMRQMLRDHPEQLQVLKQALQTEHPEIAQMIGENPQAFLDLLNQAGSIDDDAPATGTGSTGSTGSTGGVGGAGGAGGAGGPGRGTITVTLSPQEQQIIDRLQDMGFERNRVIEAFLACDRNENLAVNYLLSSFD